MRIKVKLKSNTLNSVNSSIFRQGKLEVCMAFPVNSASLLDPEACPSLLGDAQTGSQISACCVQLRSLEIVECRYVEMSTNGKTPRAHWLLGSRVVSRLVVVKASRASFLRAFLARHSYCRASFRPSSARPQ